MLSMTAFSIHAAKYEYRTVPNDPLKAKLYTLPNGLKVLHDRKQGSAAYTGVYSSARGWKKNDPAETTDLPTISSI